MYIVDGSFLEEYDEFNIMSISETVRRGFFLL